MITILIAEDEIYAKKSLVKQIQKYDEEGNFSILEAENGKQASEIFDKEHPELVLTDIRMPVMDGLQLLEYVKQKDSEVPVIMLSAYSDFEYARRAVSGGALEYLLKPIEDQSLKDCLDKFLHISNTRKRQNIILEQDAVTKFLKQKLLDDSYEDFVGSMLFQKIYHRIQVFTIYLYQDYIVTQNKILNAVETIFSREMLTGFRLFRMEHRMWVLVVNNERDNFFFPRKLAHILENEKCTFRIGVSSEHIGLAELLCAYREAKTALAYKIFFKDKILTYNMISKKEISTFQMSQSEDIMLRQALKNRNMIKIEEVMNMVFCRLEQNKIVAIESLNLFLRQLIIILQEALLNMKNNLEIKSNSSEIINYDSLDEVKNYMLRISNNLCQLQNNCEESQDVVDRIMQYASTHYELDITIKDIAEKILCMNATYLSHVFVERIGISFSTWLRSYRINEAKNMLKKKDLSITEIASMVGYNDTSQFIRAFKQETEVTPKKYRDAQLLK